MKFLIIIALSLITVRGASQFSFAPQVGANGRLFVGMYGSMEVNDAYFEAGYLSDITQKALLQLKGGWVFNNAIPYCGVSYHLYGTRGSGDAWRNGWNILFGGKYRIYIDEHAYIAPEIQHDGKYTNYILSIGWTTN